MEIIKSSTEISSLFSTGRRCGSRCITLLYQRREQHDLPGRVAFIAGKKNGNAVWRNAAKRRMRAIARELGAPWAGYDVVFLAKRGILDEDYSKVLFACRKLIRDNVEK